MKRTGNFFVEQNIAHRMQDVRIKAEREFADVTGAGVGIENIVQLLGLIARRFNNFSVFEFQPDMIKARALINCWRVKGDKAVDRVAHRCGKNFPIRNIPIATANDGWNFLNAEDRKSTRLNSSHRCISYAVFCLKKKK